MTESRGEKMTLDAGIQTVADPAVPLLVREGGIGMGKDGEGSKPI